MPLQSCPDPIRKRLDEVLIEKHFVESRSLAKALILAGRVFVSGTKQDKAGTRIDADSLIRIEPSARFASRGGEKLEGAMSDFRLSVQGKVCLDVGSSTGGFTDCLLQHGASKIYAVDVGWGQLHSRLRSDPRVVVMEKTHIARVDPQRFDPVPDFATVDVSFISLKKVILKVEECLSPNGCILALFKPQFEVGPAHLKKGIVKNERTSQEARQDFERWAKSRDFEMIGWKPSVLKGAKGNQEYFILLKRSLRGASDEAI